MTRTLDISSAKPSARSSLGVIGLPMPVKELAARRWDVIVVGAGHNGLACAAYLARAGKQVLVLEARERVGGACTLEEPWPGFRVSPCAYLCGLLHPLVIEELNFPAWGYHWTPATAGMFVPFQDGSYVHLPEDDGACEDEIKRFAPQDLAGWRAMGDVMRRARNALRPAGWQAMGGAFSPDDLWLNPAPTREQIEDRLAGDDEARGLLFDWSMAEYVERYLTDERLQMAYLGQGVIGTFASPFDPGTASVNFHHSSGRLGGMPGMWGYVRGGMGMVSFIVCDIARDLGAVVAAGIPVARILPGEGVELAGGERIHAPVIVSNADPRTTLGLLGSAADPAWRSAVEAVPIEGCSMKVSVALRELPNFTARPGVDEDHHRGQINTPLTKAEWRRAYDTARAGGLPDRLWTELYFQTAFDDTVAPAGAHLMSVFAQYVPYNFTQGKWDDWRERAGQVALESIGRFCSNIPDAILHHEVIGPRDIEQRVGLAGGHIFQGEILPQYMWDQRLSYQTPMDGVYLCGAATHPGGSVIGVNGRNAAMVVLQR